MPSRGRYLRRKYSARRLRLRGRVRELEKLATYAAAAVILVLAVLLIRRYFFIPEKKVNIPVEDVAAFRIPNKTLPELKALADKYGIEFAQLVTIYSVEHKFFPSKSESPASGEIEQSFVVNYENVRKSYKSAALAPYYNMMSTLLSEMQFFPVPSAYDKEESASYMFGDSWGIKQNRGADILDRENIKGRVPVVAMAAGTITDAGWKESTGYQIKILSSRDTLYCYSNMDSLDDGLVTGGQVQPGQLLGYMGSVKNVPARLHLEISPYFEPVAKDFWINPYPFLRLLEGTKAEYSE